MYACVLSVPQVFLEILTPDTNSGTDGELRNRFAETAAAPSQVVQHRRDTHRLTASTCGRILQNLLNKQRVQHVQTAAADVT